MLGTVKFFDATRGFGFLAPAAGKDVFVHASAIAAAGILTLNEGQCVTFDVQQDTRGPRAVNLKLA